MSDVPLTFHNVVGVVERLKNSHAWYHFMNMILIRMKNDFYFLFMSEFLRHFVHNWRFFHTPYVGHSSPSASVAQLPCLRRMSLDPSAALRRMSSCINCIPRTPSSKCNTCSVDQVWNRLGIWEQTLTKSPQICSLKASVSHMTWRNEDNGVCVEADLWDSLSRFW